MAHQRAGQETEARATLARTIQAIETQLPTPGIGDPYDSVGHWIFIQIARQQAEALIPLRPELHICVSKEAAMQRAAIETHPILGRGNTIVIPVV